MYLATMLVVAMLEVATLVVAMLEVATLEVARKVLQARQAQEYPVE